ncbi:hypothetical protein [Trebonia sp.]|uniref:hypothetical protein n=1 Tax=Trebonia sp. TaxID=2767075 RepID=UPI00262455B2|nr:hypothetical protein [Trebonia sp.]
MSATTRPTLAEIKKSWPPAVDVTALALALGVSRSSAYEAIRAGTCPVKTITVGHRVKALTADLIRVLETGTAMASGRDGDPEAA